MAGDCCGERLQLAPLILLPGGALPLAIPVPADALQVEEQCPGGRLRVNRLLYDLPRLLHMAFLCVRGANRNSQGVPPAQFGVDQQSLACI